MTEDVSVSHPDSGTVNPLSGLRRPALAKSAGLDTLGLLPDLSVQNAGSAVVVGAALQGWRRRFVDVVPGVSLTCGAFQVVALPRDGDAAADAVLAPLRAPDLPWSYLLGESSSNLFLSAIPRTEPRAVVARATACMIRWAGLSPEARRRTLKVADDRLVHSFDVEVDPSVLDRAERLLILNTLYVHPAARGQQLGVRMLWGVIVAMGFTRADAVVADPWPIGTPWSQSNGPFVPVGQAAMSRAFDGIHALCNYYQPLGLRLMPARTAAIPALVLSTSRVPGL
jgi:GNAT superfamily N-acetyltransferase